jgi:hypothetical protein
VPALAEGPSPSLLPKDLRGCGKRKRPTERDGGSSDCRIDINQPGCCNSNGETRVLEVTKTAKEAHDRAATVAQDFAVLTMAEWCKRYDVPISFVSE